MDNERLPVLLLGSKGRLSVRGKEPSMTSKTIKALKRVEYEGLLLVCEVNEDYTSRVCYLCQERSNEEMEVNDNFSGREFSLWGRVLQCSICQHQWNRDANDAHNIMSLGILQHTGVKCPDVFIYRANNHTEELVTLSEDDDSISIDENEFDVNIEDIVVDMMNMIENHPRGE